MAFRYWRFSIAVLVLSLTIIGNPLTMSRSSAFTAQQSSSCLSAVRAEYQGFNRGDAISSAQASTMFRTVAAGYSNVTYSSIFETGISTPSVCDVSDVSLNVVFSAHNLDGFANIVVSEDLGTLVPVSVQIQQNPDTFAVSSVFWAGYEIYANSGATQNVYSAQTNYNLPTISWPSTGCYNNYACTVATWVGLVDELGGSPDGHLAQDGFVANISCSSCTPKYYEYYEMLPAGAIFCGGTNIHAGNSAVEYTTNDAAYGGSDTTYAFYVSDDTTGAYCFTDGNSYPAMPSPTRGEFMVEDPTCTYPCTLAKFTTVKFVDSEIFTSGQLYYIDKF